MSGRFGNASPMRATGRPRAGVTAVSRRGFLIASGFGAAVALSGCGEAAGSGGAGSGSGAGDSGEPSFILAGDPEVAAAEAARTRSGAESAHLLRVQQGLVDLGSGRRAATWGFTEDAALAALGPTLRVSRGDRLIVDVENALEEDTSVHWHGLRIRCDMDGAPPDTQDPIAPGERFRYDFTVPDAGTFWYHSHSGLQMDRAVFGAVVVEDPDDATGADADLVLVLDDWLDGIAATPDEVFAAMGATATGEHAHGAGGSAGSAGGGAAQELVAGGTGSSEVLGGPTQHIDYPLHLVNGRSPDDPDRLAVAPGSRVRVRVINAGAETPYRIALAGHRLTVISADGFETLPHETDAVLIAPAQRVDLLVDLASGAWPFVARVEGRDAAGLAVIATSDASGATPSGDAATRIPELDRELATDAVLEPAESAVLPERDPDRHWRLELLEATEGFQWGIGGDTVEMLPRIGDRVRLDLVNSTSMWHPMHLHGHTYASRTHRGLRRDTSAVLPGETVTVDFDADNPGHWMIHCHNVYHFAAGMTAPVRYVR